MSRSGSCVAGGVWTLASHHLGIVLPEVTSEHVWHLYVVRVPDREAVAAPMAELGVQTGIHDPLPIHLQPAYAHLGHRPGDSPVAEATAKEILSLPIYSRS